MYIANRPLSAGYKFFIAIISWISLWLLFYDYQNTALSFFATFLSILSGIYFIGAALKVLFWHRHHPWRAFCPVGYGSLVLGAVLMLITQVVSVAFPDAQIQLPLGVSGLLTGLVLPILIIFDWVLFSAKGHWRWIDPWYWLYLPLIYLAINYLLIGVIIGTDPVTYPYGFLDYLTLGVIPTLIWISGILMGCLGLGFLFVGCDLALQPKEPEHSSQPATVSPTQPTLEPAPKLSQADKTTSKRSSASKSTKASKAAQATKSHKPQPKATPKLVDVRPNAKAKSRNKRPTTTTKTKPSSQSTEPEAAPDDTKSARSIHGKTQVED